MFAEGSSATRSVDEDAEPGAAIGAPVSATDADAVDTLTYSLRGVDAASFAIDASSGQLKTKAGLDHEAKSTYSVVVRVDDGFVVVSITVTITVTDVNEAPEFPPGAPSLDVDENTASGVAFGDAVVATDPDGDVLTYTLGGTHASVFSIDSTTGQLQTKGALDYEGSRNTYQVTVTATDGGGLTDAVTVDISVNDVGEAPGRLPAPQVEGSSDSALTVTWKAPGDGSGITGYDVRYRPKGSREFTDVTDKGTGTTAMLTGLSSGTTYEVQVRARNADGAGEWSESGEGRTDSSNTAPIFSEGASASRSVNEDAVLGVAIGAPVSATDADSVDTLTYSLRGVDAASFAIDASSGQLKTKAALDYEAKSSYSVVVRVDDGFVVVSIAVTITVTDVNEAPEFPPGSPSLDVDENTASGVAFGGPVAATDPDGDALTYTLSGVHSAVFAVDASSGQLRTRGSLDYEGTRNTYQVTVTAADGGGLTDAVTVDISVNDVAEAPGRLLAPRVEGSSDSVLTVTWKAPSGGSGITGYDVRYRPKGSGEFTDVTYKGTGATAELTGLSSGTTYEVQVRARNADGAGEWSESGEGRTGSSNSAPIFSEGVSASRSVNEDAVLGVAIGVAVSATDADASDTLTYSLRGVDAASFAIDASSGQLKTKAGLDYEAKSSYSVVVRVDDGFVVVSIAVTITVTDVNEAPEFPPGAPSLDVDENTAPGVAFGDAVAATDPDGDALTYTLSGAHSAVFAIDASSGQLRTKGALDYEGSRNTYQVTVTAADGGGLTDAVTVDISVNDVAEAPGRLSAPQVEGSSASSLTVTWKAASGGSGITGYDVRYRPKGSGEFTDATYKGTGTTAELTGLLSATEYEVQVRARNADGAGVWSESGEGRTDSSNSAPIFSEGASSSRSVNENTGKGTAIGAPVSATDADSADTLTYSLRGVDAASFAIDAASGQLKTKAVLDYEAKSSYSVVVRVDDGFVVVSIAVTITVSDVNETPEFPPGSPSLDVDENTASGVAFGDAVAATDPDGDALTYTLGGTHSAVFGIDSTTGQLRTKGSLDYEGTRNTYQVTVTAADGGGLTDAVTVDILVNDVTEAPGRLLAPRVEAASDSVLTVTWKAPSGGSGITGYDVRYRPKGSGKFTDVTYKGTGTTAMLAGLSSGTTYEVQVRARNADGAGGWSESGEGRTDSSNTAPIFSEGASASRSVNEDAGPGAAIGVAVSATDADASDTLTYSLRGVDAASFAIDASSGQLKTKAGLDYEAKSSYSVVVRVDDGFVVVSIAVTITVADVNEAPELPPGAPSLDVDENTAPGVAFGGPVAATDPDGDTLTYTLSGAHAALFGIDSTTGQLRTKGALDYEGTRNTYQVTVTATDGGGLTDTVTVDISVNDVAEAPGRLSAPKAEGLSDSSLTVTWQASGGGSGITGYDVRYRVKEETGEFTNANHQGTVTTAVLTGLSSATTYEVQVRARSADGTGEWSESGEGRTDSSNRAPVFAEGSSATRSADEGVGPGAAIGVAVSATDADAADTLTYSLRGVDAASFVIDASSGQLRTKATLDHETKSSYSVTVRVDDGFVVVSIAVTITVMNVNEAPEFPPGSPSLDVDENTVSGVAFGAPVIATDPDGDTLTYTLGGTHGAVFGIDSTTGQLRTKGSLDYEGTRNTYQVAVTATDGGGLTDAVTVDISVNDVAEDPGRLSAPKVEGSSDSSLTVTWQASGGGSGITGYDVRYRPKESGEFTDATHEGTRTTVMLTGLLSGTTYEVQVRARNAGGAGEWSEPGEGRTDSSNSAPTFSEGVSASRSVNEGVGPGAAIGVAVSATDADAADTLTYSLRGVDAASFAIDAASGQLKTKTALDHEAKSSYSVIVRADDGFVVVSIAVTITVADVNEAPEFPPGAPSLDVDENTASGVAFGDAVTATDPDGDALTYTLGGTHAALFAIDASSGQVRTKGALDYEGTRNTYVVIVRANDGLLTGTVRVDISVNDVGEAPGRASAPRVEASPGHVDSSLTVSWKAPPSMGAAITGYDVRYRGKGTGAFMDANYRGRGTTVTLTGLSSGTTYEVQIRPRNMKGVGEWSESGEGSTGLASSAPVFTEGLSATRSVAEDVEPGVVIGAPVSAIDADPSDTLTYSLRGVDAVSFAIDASSGQLRTKAPLDYEARSSYSVIVQVDDGFVVVPIAVTITVTNVNEAPEFPPGSPSLDVNENTATGVEFGDAVLATDPDGDVLTYMIGGKDAVVFAIDSTTGQLRTKSALNYEAQRTYDIIVRASDGLLMGSVDVSVAVNNLHELPGTPVVPRVTPAAVLGHTAIRVVWVAPDPNGSAITDYDIEYRPVGARTILPFVFRSNATQAVIAGLEPDVDYEVRVRATNDEGPGGWSGFGVGRTNAAPNTPPLFIEGVSAARSVLENSSAGQTIGGPLTARDLDSDAPVVYALSGIDSASFAIAPGTGQLLVLAALDYEVRRSYTVTVTASDVQGASSGITVAIRVRNVSEPPAAPLEPILTATTTQAGALSLHASWQEPESAGPPVTGYQVEHRSLGGFFAPIPHNGLERWVVISGLDSEIPHEIRVRGINSEGVGTWSDPAHYDIYTRRYSGFSPIQISPTSRNSSPDFAEGNSARRSVDENTPPGAIGRPISARDDDGDVVTYTLHSSDADLFEIDAGSGQLSARVSLDYETAPVHSVVVRARDSFGAVAGITVAIEVKDIDEPPDAPIAPSVAPAEVDGHVTLALSWSEPRNSGPPITGYDVQRRESGHLAFVDTPHDGAALNATIDGLRTGVVYEVRVRARNDEGVGSWSAIGSGATAAAPNRPPSFTEGDGAARVVDEHTPPGEPIGAPVAASDPDSDALVYALAGADQWAFGIDQLSGQLLTKEPLNYEAQASYSVAVKVRDGRDGEAAIEVMIYVGDVNDAPVAVADTATTVEDEAVVVQALRNDIDPDAGSLLRIVAVAQPENGATVAGADGAITYTPRANYHGSDAFTYVVTDGAATAVASVEIKVRPVNDSPVADGRVPIQTASVGASGPTIDMAPYFFDIDGDALSYRASATAAGVVLRIESGKLDITAADAGESSVTVSATDPAGASAQVEFTLIALRPVPSGAGQRVGLVLPGAAASLTAPFGHSVEFPARARGGPFQARISQGLRNCANLSGGEVIVCVTVDLFDLHANPLNGELDNPAALSFVLSPRQYARVVTASGAGRLRVMRQATAIPECADLEVRAECFVLISNIQGGGEIRIVNIFAFSRFAIEIAPPPLPEFIEGAVAYREVPENAPVGAIVGEPIVAFAASSSAPLTYSVGVGSGLFAVDPGTGQIVVKREAALDHESPENPYAIEIIVDAGGVSASIAVIITATNAPELGFIVLTDPHDDPGGAIIAALTDPDGGVANVRWQWERSLNGGAWTAICGATATAYVPTEADIGMLLRAIAVYDDAARAGIRLISDQVGPIRSLQSIDAPPPTPRAGPSPTVAPLQGPTRDGLSARGGIVVVLMTAVVVAQFIVARRFRGRRG